MILYMAPSGARGVLLDFQVRLGTGTMLVLEVKGQGSLQNQTKRAALDEWTPR